MATFTLLPSGAWRVQVRRKGACIADTFLRKTEAQAWAREAEIAIDAGLPRSDPSWGDTERAVYLLHLMRLFVIQSARSRIGPIDCMRGPSHLLGITSPKADVLLIGAHLPW
jgi:hypothetical protein